MAEHRLIQRYHDVLRAELPAQLAEEVADGLAEANAKYLRHGLSQDDAAQAAVAEFGDARAVAEAFARSSSARRTARTLIATGPIVGGCWAFALIAGRAWDWPVPNAARLLLGVTLIARSSLCSQPRWLAATGLHSAPDQSAAQGSPSSMSRQSRWLRPPFLASAGSRYWLRALAPRG